MKARFQPTGLLLAAILGTALQCGAGDTSGTTRTAVRRADSIPAMTKGTNAEAYSANSFAEATAPKNKKNARDTKSPSSITDGSRTRFDPKTKTWVNVAPRKSRKPGTDAADPPAYPVNIPVSGSSATNRFSSTTAR